VTARSTRRETEKEAEKVQTRLRNQVDERRSPRTEATVNELLDRWLDVIDLLMDPITLVVAAVAMGASAGLSETAVAVVKDAYAGLKALLTGRAVDVSGVERRPDSPAQQVALQETLADAGGVDDEVVAAARAVTDAVAAHAPDAERVVGVRYEQAGDIRSLLDVSFAEYAPLLRAVQDLASGDDRLRAAYSSATDLFCDAVAERIEREQQPARFAEPGRAPFRHRPRRPRAVALSGGGARHHHRQPDHRANAWAVPPDVVVRGTANRANRSTARPVAKSVKMVAKKNGSMCGTPPRKWPGVDIPRGE